MSTRIAVVDENKCQPKKCNQECKKICPSVRMGKLCIEIDVNKTAKISEQLCISTCNICTKHCPFDAIKVINLPTNLSSSITHRYGANSFKLHRFPHMKRGHILGLVGNNGIGKSTTLKMMAGQPLPNFGRYFQTSTIDDVIDHFRGTEIQQFFIDMSKTNEDTKSCVYKIQYVDQISQKYKQTLRTALPDDNSRAVKYRQLFSLDHLLDRVPENLSGGELQRFACAVACSKQSKLYMFDEPSSYLDIKQRIAMAKTLRSLQEHDNYIVIVEHDLSIMDYVSDYTCLFYGMEGVYGVISDAFNVRDGINIYLDGYLPTENMRFRDYSISFNITTDINPEIIKPMPIASYESLTYNTSESKDDILKLSNNFTLVVDAGQLETSQCVVLLGENGLGKTTFVRLLAGLIPPYEMISKRISVSYKPQKISPKFTGTVRQLLLLKIQSAFVDHAFVTDIINPLKLPDIYDQNLDQLSGGQLQRVAIALCLGKPADIYLIDEPSSYLDSEQRISVAKLIKRFIINSKKTALIVEHDFMMSTYLADKVILFDGNSGISGHASSPMPLKEGMNLFLQSLGISLRTDTETGRPRINKENSQLDQEQKASGQLW